MNRIVRFVTTASAVAGLVVPQAQAQREGKPTVAILYFNNNAFTKDARDLDGLTKGVPDFLITEMSSNRNIRVIERDQVVKLIEEQKLITGGQVDRETAVKVGKLLGAQHMIFGGFMADPKGNFRIDARAVNVQTGEIEHTERVQDKADNIMPLIAQLAEKLNAGMHLPSSPAAGTDASAPAASGSSGTSGSPSTGARQTGAPAATPKLPMRLAVMYGKALDLKDHGDKSRATELFSAVLKEFPDYEPARAEQRKLKGA